MCVYYMKGCYIVYRIQNGIAYNGGQIIPYTCILYIRVIYSIMYIKGIIYHGGQMVP